MTSFSPSINNTNKIDSSNSTSYTKVSVIDELETGQSEFISKPLGTDNSTFNEAINNERYLRWKTIISTWLSIVLALLAGSSVGPVFKYMIQHHIPPLLAASWRGQCMAIFLIPMALVESLHPDKRVNWLEIKPGLPYPIIVHTIFSGIAWSGNLLFWILGLRYVSSFMGSLIFSTHPLMLCLFLKIIGSPVSCIEMTGVMISFIGLLVSCLPDLLSPVSSSETATVTVTASQMAFGIALCFASAGCEVVVLFNRIATKKHVPLMQYTAATSVVVMLISTITTLILEHSIIICTHSHTESCIWGWTSPSWILTILAFGFVVGVVFIAGFNYALQHIPPLVFSSLSLADPALTAGFSWVFGIEGLPSLLSWLGGAVVMAGVGVISYGEHHRTSSTPRHDKEEGEVELVTVLSSSSEQDQEKEPTASKVK